MLGRDRGQGPVGDLPLRHHHVERDHREVEERPVLHLFSQDGARGEEDLAARPHDHEVAFSEDSPGRGFEQLGSAADPLHEDARGREGRLDVGYRAPHGRVLDAEGAHVPFAVGGPVPSLGLHPRRSLGLQLAAFGLEVDPQQPRGQAGKEPHDEARAHEIADRVGHRNVVQQPLLLGRGEVEAGDRVAGRADDRGLREGARHEPGCGAAVVAHELGEPDRGRQAGHAEHDGEQGLGEGVLLEAAEELGPDLVPGGEQEQVEEDDLDQGVDLDVELAHEHSREEGAHDVPQAEGPEAEPPDREAQGEGQEDRELGVLPQGVDEPGHGGFLQAAAACESFASRRRPKVLTVSTRRTTAGCRPGCAASGAPGAAAPAPSGD